MSLLNLHCFLITDGVHQLTDGSTPFNAGVTKMQQGMPLYLTGQQGVLVAQFWGQ
jgi:hypothetical protein